MSVPLYGVIENLNNKYEVRDSTIMFNPIGGEKET
jgi:hypothetical protein